MNPIAKMLLDMARFYGHELDKRQLEMYVQVLTQFDEDKVLHEARAYMFDVKNNKFPIPPHKIMAKHMPQAPTDENLSVEVAARVRQAISKFGWNNPEEAEKFIGDIGWGIVLRYGGWLHLCQNLGVTIAEGTFQAQVRELCKSHMQLSRSGNLNQPINLNASPNQPLNEMVGNMVNRKLLNK